MFIYLHIIAVILSFASVDVVTNILLLSAAYPRELLTNSSHPHWFVFILEPSTASEARDHGKVLAHSQIRPLRTTRGGPEAPSLSFGFWRDILVLLERPPYIL